MNNLTKIDRARILRRCRKPALSSMEYGSITSELDGISWVCQNLHYFYSDETTLLDALDEDEEREQRKYWDMDRAYDIDILTDDPMTVIRKVA